MKYFRLLLCGLLILSCKQEQQVITLTAMDIVNKSIAISGGKQISNSAIDFTFRDKAYIATREQGKFSLMRLSGDDSTGIIIDELNNVGFTRRIGAHKNGKFETVHVADSMIPKYSASVNSVHYFSVLPYGLNDEAVNKSLLGEEQIKGKTYYKVKVTFDKEGGGEDFEDEFIYWIDNITFKVDYLAYSYNEEDGKGMRFREAFNERYIEGIRFVDYNNYNSQDSLVTLSELGKSFNNDQLQQLSKIELEAITVDLINF